MRRPSSIRAGSCAALWRCAAIAVALLTVPAFAAAKKPAARSRAAKPAPSPKAPVAGTGLDSLAGNLPGVLLPGKLPYLVVADVYVPQGKRVTIDAGTVLLFRNFTGLHVMGTLVVKGVKENPVVFTSVNDKEYNKKSTLDAAPFDWNGIYLHEDAVGSELSFCAVLYSVEGITSMTKFVKLSSCLFLNNGRSNLTIEGVQHEVGTTPYDYALTVGDAALSGVPLDILKDPHAPARNTVRYSGIVLAAGGCVLGVIYASRYSGSLDSFRALSGADPDNLTDHSSVDWDNARHAKNRDLGAMLASLGVAVIGGVTISISFGF